MRNVEISGLMRYKEGGVWKSLGNRSINRTKYLNRGSTTYLKTFSFNTKKKAVLTLVPSLDIMVTILNRFGQHFRTYYPIFIIFLGILSYPRPIGVGGTATCEIVPMDWNGSRLARSDVE